MTVTAVADFTTVLNVTVDVSLTFEAAPAATFSDTITLWNSAEQDYPRFIIKGGIAFQKWRGDNYWVNYFDVKKPFLTWQLNGRLAAPNERMYLSWVNLTEVTQFRIKRKLVFTDGSENIATVDIGVPRYTIMSVPAGATQLALSSVNPSKKIYYWELQIFYQISDLDVSEAFRYYLDNRNDYNQITLNYRNSKGALDSVRIRGVINYDLNRQNVEAERIAPGDYFQNHYVQGRIASINSTESLVYKGNTGYVTKTEHDRLRDLHYKRECWWEQQKKWIPVRLLTGSGKLKSSDDKLWSMAVEFEIANNGDNFYTPDDIDLAEGAIPALPLCDVVIGTPEWNYVEGSGWGVSWLLVSGSPSKYYVSTPGVSGGAPHETITTSYLFPWLPAGENIITITPLCLIGTDYHFGEPIEITITV